VGGALNWHGQPQAQLQVTAPSPEMRHLVPIVLMIESHHELWFAFSIDLYKAGATVKQRLL
jgi:hypothetical protein